MTAPEPPPPGLEPYEVSDEAVEETLEIRTKLHRTDQYLYSPRFVGREREFERLQGHLERVMDGAGKVVFISGESGIGKTRLVDEFVLVSEAGVANAIGQAIDESTFDEQEGTLAGDNTILVLFANEERLETWLERFEALRSVPDVLGRAGPYRWAQVSLRRHIPEVAVQWHLGEPDRRWRQVDGTLVFADISGFTALSERLARRGRVGAEELTEVLAAAVKAQMEAGKTTFIEVLNNQELGEPFRRDAMKKPVPVAGIDKADMRPQAGV